MIRNEKAMKTTAAPMVKNIEPLEENGDFDHVTAKHQS